MDSFGNYPREEPFDPFAVMLFKGLQVIAFLFFIALLVINPEAKSGKVDTKAEFIISMAWPDNHPDDLDLYVQDPAGNLVWFHEREAGWMLLERDDRGGLNNSISVNGAKIKSPIREETVSIRGIIPGEYVVNVNHFDATTGVAVPVSVKVEKINPTLQVLYYDTFNVNQKGLEVTAVRFTIAADGSVVDVKPVGPGKSASQGFKSLIQETRTVRRGAK
jgi:hypothetical protein